jgi:hypothetical protein
VDKGLGSDLLKNEGRLISQRLQNYKEDCKRSCLDRDFKGYFPGKIEHLNG